MFYDKFRSIVSCSVIKVTFEEPSCTGCCESIQVFKHFNQLYSQSSLYKADEIKVLDSLVVLWFLTSGIIFVARLCIFSILSMSRLKYRDQNCTACSRCGRTRDLYNGRFSSLFLYQVLCWPFSAFLYLFLPLEVFGDGDS